MSKQNLMLGDCVEWMKRVPDKYYDLAIVDPEYGIDAANMTMGSGKNKRWNKKDWDKKKPSKEYFEQLFRITENQIIWGGNYFNLPISRGWIFWDKGINGDCSFADGELAWTNFDRVLRIAPIRYKGFLGADKERIHITQKPIALYKWLLTNYAKQGQKIFDSHGGSFSHAIAAYDLGFDLDIIEIDPDYFRDGKERYDKHVLKCEEIKQLGFAKTDLSKINPTLF